MFLSRCSVHVARSVRRKERALQAARLKGARLACRFFRIHRQESEAWSKRDARPRRFVRGVFNHRVCWRCFNDPFLWTTLGVSSIRTGHSLAARCGRDVPRSIAASRAGCTRSKLAFAAFFKMSYRCEQNRNTSLALEIYEIAQCLLCFVLFAKKCSFCNSDSWASLTPGIQYLSPWGITVYCTYL